MTSALDQSCTLAKARVEAARALFRDALADTRDRLQPDRLKADAAHAASKSVDNAKAAARESIDRHPVLIWSILGLIALWIFRRPGWAALSGAGTAVQRLWHKYVSRSSTDERE